MAKKRKIADDTADVSGAPEGTVLQLGADGPSAERIVYHIDTIAGLKKRLREIQGRLTKAWQAAEADGLDKKASEQTMKLQNDDPKEVAAYIRNLVRTCDAVGVDLQLNLLDADAELGRPAQIFQEGFTLGVQGGALKSDKFRPDSEEWNIFANGWHAGQKSIFKIGKETLPDGRKPASGEGVATH